MTNHPNAYSFLTSITDMILEDVNLIEDFSEDEFQAKNPVVSSSSNVVRQRAVLEEKTSNKTRKKPLIRMKAGEAAKFVAEALNKSNSDASFSKVHVSHLQ